MEERSPPSIQITKQNSEHHEDMASSAAIIQSSQRSLRTLHSATRSSLGGLSIHNIDSELKRVGTHSSVATNATFQTAVGSLRDVDDGELDHVKDSHGTLRGTAVVVVEEEDESAGSRCGDEAEKLGEAVRLLPSARISQQVDGVATEVEEAGVEREGGTSYSQRGSVSRETSSRSKRKPSTHSQTSTRHSSPSGRMSARNSETTIRVPHRQHTSSSFLLKNHPSKTFSTGSSTLSPRPAAGDSPSALHSSFISLSRQSSPPTPPADPITQPTEIDWKDPANRAREYAEADRRRKSLWWKLQKAVCCGAAEEEFWDGDEDSGSVRRYRLDLPEETEKRSGMKKTARERVRQVL